MIRTLQSTLIAIAVALTRRESAQTRASQQTSDRPPMNILHGVVVSRATGQPLAGVPVVMTHGQNAYLYISETGPSGALATRDRGCTTFAARNSRLLCDAYSGDDGSFTLLNFAAPDEPWNLAAGNPDVGVALLAGIIPRGCMEQPLRIEIDQPAYVVVVRPTHSADQTLDAHVEISPVLPATELKAPQSRDPTLAELPEPRIYCSFYCSAKYPDTDECRMGPLPPGFNYRVGRHVYGRRLSYHATEFERTVHLAPGATEHVSLEAGPGATISGRLTDTHDMPLADVNVTVRASDATGLVIGALSNQDGRYSLAGVPAGGYLLELLRHARPAAPT